MSELAAVYARISSDREGDALGVQRQIDDATALAASLGYEVVQTYVDNDRGASTRSKAKRPEYAAMLDAARRTEFTAIIAYSNSRLTRRPREFEDLIDLYERCGVRIRTVVSGDDDLSTADGRFLARIKANMDTAEAERISERVSRAARQAAESGLWHGGPRPFGYEADGVTVRDVEAQAIREGYRVVIHGGSVGSVARLWNDARLFTGRSGSRWDINGVREVLTSPRYIGKRAYRGEIVADAEWPGIVDPDVFETVSVRLRDPSRRHGPRSTKRLLTGIAVCGVCGGRIHGSGSTADRPAYRCAESQGHFARKAEPIDDYVVGLTLGRLARPDVLAALSAAGSRTPDDEDIHERLRAARERLDQIAVEFADGELTASQLRAATERLRGRIAEDESSLSTSASVDALSPFMNGGDVDELWAALDNDRRRIIIDALMTVTIHPAGRGSKVFRPESVGIEWKG